MDTEGVILAAGFSKRAGTHKMALDIRGRTVLERCIEGMYDACSKIIIVLGYGKEDLYPVIKKYQKAVPVFNRDFSQGMFSSVKTGLVFVEADRFFLTPGDYPLIKGDTYQRMKRVEGEIIVPEFKGVRGHPVLMESRLINEILNSAQFTSLKAFINTRKTTPLCVEDPGILMDLDTEADYRRLLDYFCYGYNNYR